MLHVFSAQRTAGGEQASVCHKGSVCLKGSVCQKGSLQQKTFARMLSPSGYGVDSSMKITEEPSFRSSSRLESSVLRRPDGLAHRRLPPSATHSP